MIQNQIPQVALPVLVLIRLRDLVETSNQSDPGGFLHIFAGGVLAAMAKWFWDKLVKTTRPPRSEKSTAFIASEMRQLKKSVDGMSGTVRGIEGRLDRLERKPKGHPPANTID